MKYLVIGAGRTGSEVVKLIPEDQLIAACDKDNPVTDDMLEQADVAIVFTDAGPFGGICEQLLSHNMPAVIGTTGYEFPEDLDAKLKEKNIAWVRASNFGAGTNLAFHLAKILGNVLSTSPGFEGHSVSIHDVHHINKKDAPSGTAKTFKELLGNDEMKITSERLEDAKGTHTIRVELPGEEIEIKHEAFDRVCFAKGAVTASGMIEELQPGLHNFNDIFIK